MDYRSAPTLRDILAKNVPDPPNNQNKLAFFQGKCFFIVGGVLRVPIPIRMAKMYQLYIHHHWKRIPN